MDRQDGLGKERAYFYRLYREAEISAHVVDNTMHQQSGFPLAPKWQ